MDGIIGLCCGIGRDDKHGLPIPDLVSSCRVCFTQQEHRVYEEKKAPGWVTRLFFDDQTPQKKKSRSSVHAEQRIGCSKRGRVRTDREKRLLPEGQVSARSAATGGGDTSINGLLHVRLATAQTGCRSNLDSPRSCWMGLMLKGERPCVLLCGKGKKDLSVLSVPIL